MHILYDCSEIGSSASMMLVGFFFDMDLKLDDATSVSGMSVGAIL